MLRKFGLIATVAAAICAAVLFAPPPGPSQAQFADQSTYGGTSTGAANVQVITIQNLSAHKVGVPLRFTPGFANTGPATINVSGLGAVAIVRPSSIGNVALSSSELLAGELTEVIYNGTAYQLASNVDMTPIGRTVEYRGASTPRGTLVEDGSCVSRTTYAPLFSVIGTTYGACDGSTTFGLPDSRGTMFAALDNQGANGNANRITSAGSGCTATAVGLCGAQNQTLSTAQLPVVTPSGTIANGAITINNGANVAIQGGSNGPNTFPPGFALVLAAVTASQATSTFTGTPFGSGTAHPILNPISLGRRAIKY